MKIALGLLVVGLLSALQWSTASAISPATDMSSTTDPFRPPRGGFFNLLAVTAAVKTTQPEEQRVFDNPLGASDVDEDRDAPLMADLELLSGILSDLVNREDPAVHSLYESFRKLGMKRAMDTTDTEALKQMVEEASKLTPAQAVGVTRTFSIMLNLVNAAEVHHRFRRLKESEKYWSDKQNAVPGPLPFVEDSVRGTIEALLENGDATPMQILDQLQKQRVEIVLTAHPTQVSTVDHCRDCSHPFLALEETHSSLVVNFCLAGTTKVIVAKVQARDRTSGPIGEC